MGFISSGTTMFDNGALVASAGSQVLLSTATASASASLSFNSTYINSDYLVYKFEFINCHPQTDDQPVSFQASTNNGSTYGVTLTTTVFEAYHFEDDSATFLGYHAHLDLAQSTAFQPISGSCGNGADDNVGGTLTLYNPSSTTYVKHFIANTQGNYRAGLPISINRFTAGYFNTTSAVNAIQFKFSSGNIDAGQIKLYGIKN